MRLERGLMIPLLCKSVLLGTLLITCVGGSRRFYTFLIQNENSSIQNGIVRFKGRILKISQ